MMQERTVPRAPSHIGGVTAHLQQDPAERLGRLVLDRDLFRIIHRQIHVLVEPLRATRWDSREGPPGAGLQPFGAGGALTMSVPSMRKSLWS